MCGCTHPSHGPLDGVASTIFKVSVALASRGRIEQRCREGHFKLPSMSLHIRIRVSWKVSDLGFSSLQMSEGARKRQKTRAGHSYCVSCHAPTTLIAPYDLNHDITHVDSRRLHQLLQNVMIQLVSYKTFTTSTEKLPSRTHRERHPCTTVTNHAVTV